MANRYLSEEHLSKLKERVEYLENLIRELSKMIREHAPRILSNRVGSDDLTGLFLGSKDELAKLTIEIEILEKYLSGE